MYTSARYPHNKALVIAASLLGTLGVITLALGLIILQGVLNRSLLYCKGETLAIGVASGGVSCREDWCKLAVDTSQAFVDNSPSWKK